MSARRPARPCRPAVPAAAVLAAAVLAAGALAAGAGPAAAATPSPAEPAASGTPRIVDRTLTDPRIVESSGLVASGRRPGILWTFNDSGGEARLFAVARSGATVATLDVRGENPVDWEAATGVRGTGGESLIAIADVGDNRAARPGVRIVVVREPAALRNATTDPLREIRLTYPDGPVDAEALVADPATRRLYVVTKGLLGGRVYAVPQALWPGTARTPDDVDGVLELVAQVPLTLVTDGVALPDGRVALRTYTELAIMPPLATLAPPDPVDAPRWQPLATAALPRQGQGEGIAVDAAGAFLLSTEGALRPVLRFVAPADVMAAQPTPTPTPTIAPSTPDGTDPDGTDPDGAGGGAPAAGARGPEWGVLGVFVAAALLAAVLAGATVLLTARARRR